MLFAPWDWKTRILRALSGVSCLSGNRKSIPISCWPHPVIFCWYLLPVEPKQKPPKAQSRMEKIEIGPGEAKERYPVPAVQHLPYWVIEKFRYKNKLRQWRIIGPITVLNNTLEILWGTRSSHCLLSINLCNRYPWTKVIKVSMGRTQGKRIKEKGKRC